VSAKVLVPELEFFEKELQAHFAVFFKALKEQQTLPNPFSDHVPVQCYHHFKSKY
jgi:hypothetical protein